MRKYILYVTMLMSMQCMQVAIVVFGSREPMFFDYDVVDGFRWVRIVSLVSSNIVCLALHFPRPLYLCLLSRMHNLRAGLSQKVWKLAQVRLREIHSNEITTCKTLYSLKCLVDWVINTIQKNSDHKNRWCCSHCRRESDAFAKECNQEI